MMKTIKNHKLNPMNWQWTMGKVAGIVAGVFCCLVAYYLFYPPAKEAEGEGNTANAFQNAAKKTAEKIQLATGIGKVEKAETVNYFADAMNFLAENKWNAGKICLAIASIFGIYKFSTNDSVKTFVKSKMPSSSKDE